MSLGREMTLILQEIENYWFEANNLVPPGRAVGLKDNAYASLLLVQWPLRLLQDNFW
jgi:hypothetical protein